MQARQTLIALLVSMAIFCVAFFAFSKFFPAPVPTTRPAAATQPATAPASFASTRPGSAPASAEAPMTVSVPMAPGGLIIPDGPSREHVTLGSAAQSSPYPMQLEIDPVGADITDAWIRGHYETVKREKPYHILQTVTETDGGKSVGDSFATEVRFDQLNTTVSLADRVWTLDGSSTESKKIWTLYINLADGKPLARVVKTYELPAQKPEDRTYDLKLSLRIENLSKEPARLIVTQRGSVGLQQEDPRSEDRLVVTGMQLADKIKPSKHTRKEVAKVPELSLGKDDENGRVAWLSESNKYFACIMAPSDPANGEPRIKIAEAQARTLSKEDLPAHTPSDLTFAFVTAPLPVDPGSAAELRFDCYVGPKSKVAFQSVEPYKSRDYYAVLRESFYPCAPAALTALMMWLLNIFHYVGLGNYGVAIIILVLVVRTILHPITKTSQVNMVKMQKNMARMQPKIEAVKQKYANDRMAMNQAMMQVYKEEGVNPAGSMLSCLPMMLQIPIWGALWQALSSTIEMRHAPFDGWWIKDLAGPDALIPFSQAYNVPIISSFLTGPIHAFNLLPILLGISQLLQMKYMPKAATSAATTGPATDQMEQQRKMMMYMSGFFMLMLYNAPSGLNLYIMSSNFFGILEQWRIRQHLKAIDEKQANQPPPDTGTAGQGAKLSPRKPGPGDEPKEQNWLQRKWKELEKHADDAKRIQGQKKK